MVVGAAGAECAPRAHEAFLAARLERVRERDNKGLPGGIVSTRFKTDLDEIVWQFCNLPHSCQIHISII